VYSVKFLRPDVALVDGSLETTSAEGTRDSNRYAVVWVKSGDKWLLSSARDLPAEVEEAPSLTYPQLKSLEWLIGEWVDAGGKGSATATSGSSASLVSWPAAAPGGRRTSTSSRTKIRSFTGRWTARWMASRWPTSK